MTVERLKVENLKITADDSLLEQMKEVIYQCPKAIKYCKNLGMSDEDIDSNVIKIYDFARDINYCSNCPGLKQCKKENAYLTSKVTFNNGVVETQLIPCPTLLKRVSFERQFLIQDFPDEWLDVTMPELDRTKGRTKATVVYNKYVKNEETNWIYLTGGMRSGKSYYAAAMAIDLAKREVKGKVPICFMNASKRILELSDLNKKNNEEFKKKLEQYCTVPVLVIDDFGHEFKNDFIRDAIVNEIISSRYNKRLFTVFTSNFTLDEIEVLYECNSKAGAIMSKQIVKTIRSMCGQEVDLGDLAIYQ